MPVSAFLSYAHADRAEAGVLERQLRADGVFVWRDEQRLDASQRWPKALVEAVAASDCLLLLWSKNAAASALIELEWNTALALKKPILPCLLDATPLPSTLASIQAFRRAGAIKTAHSCIRLEHEGEVIEALGNLSPGPSADVASAVRALFTRYNWTVSSDVYQAAGNIHIAAFPQPDGKASKTKRASSDDNKAPKLSDWVRERIFQRFGVPGLVGLAFAAGGFFVWTQWETVKAWPGISSVVAYLEREPLPQADPHRFSVAVAHLEDDGASREHERLIVRLLQDFEGIQVLTFDRTISMKGSVPEERAREGHQKARVYLKESKASVLIWGSVFRYGGQTKPYLYLTAADVNSIKSNPYTIEIGTEFRLPKVFWEDLSDVLILVITTQDTQFQAENGHYVANQLRPFIERVQRLLKASANRPGWDADALTSTRVILANAMQTVGDQTGKDRPLEEAVEAYHSALQEWTREQAPLDWAKVQNNLGTALTTLGEREKGTARLQEAVEAYHSALQEWTREQAPLDWATAQNNLGTALTTLGEREKGTARLQEAVEAYECALDIFATAHATYYVSVVRGNIGRVRAMLAQRPSNSGSVFPQ